MPLSDVVDVTIVTLSRGISQAGFGTALIAGYHTEYLDLVREYSDLDALAADGFSTYHPIYRAAQKLFAQSPHPPTFKVGRRATPFSQAVELEVTDDTEGLVYSVKVISPDGTETVCSYTVQAADTLNDIAVALAALITAISGITAAAPIGAVIEPAADTAGDYFYFEELNAELLFTDVTPDPGIAADLAAIKLADNDWYALAIDSNSEAEIKAAAAVIEADSKIAAFNTRDSGCANASVTDDVASDLQAAGYLRTPIMFSKHHAGYAGAAWLGRMLPTAPGTATWAFKLLSGVIVDSLNVNETSALEGKNCNYYVPIASANVTLWGKSPSGEYIDVVRGVDWMTARIQERVFLLFLNNPKVPYTDSGADRVRSEVRAQMREGVTVGFLAGVPDFIVTVPLVADVAAADKIDRLLPDVYFEGTLAGAIHKTRMRGVLKV